MAWDSTKSTAANPDSPTADEQNPASEWNEMITYLKARVGNTLFDAYSILYADVDDTPAALTVAASRIIGRKVTGGIVAMTGAEAAALLTGLAASGANSDITSLASLTTPLSITQGGTGVTGDTYDADKVDGCHAGNGNDQVWKIASGDATHSIYVKVSTGVGALAPGTDGYQLTTHSSSGPPSWEAPGGYSHPSARQCTTGNWAWASISGKPSTYPPSAHNQSATTITSGTLPVSRGGTGVTGDTYDADKVDGCDAGTGNGNVHKIGALGNGTILQHDASAGLSALVPGTSGHQLTSNGPGMMLSYAAASDLIFSDTHCPKCGLEFQDGEILVLYLIGKNEVGDILTLPMHQSCAAEPKKTVTIKRKVMEDQYILDEDTGELKVQRVQKMQEKTVTKHKMKEGYVFDNRSGKALKIDVDGKVGKIKHNLADALEAVEETVTEVVYEDVEFEL